jgi:hypothetical protein
MAIRIVRFYWFFAVFDGMRQAPKAPSPKHQALREAPNLKLQTQGASDVVAIQGGVDVWGLEFPWILDLGIWSFPAESFHRKQRGTVLFPFSLTWWRFLAFLPSAQARRYHRIKVPQSLPFDAKF